MLQLFSCWIYILNFTKNHWILSEFYSQNWIDYSILKKTFQKNFDFIQTYFDLISLVFQFFFQFFNLCEILSDSRKHLKNDQNMKIFCHFNNQFKSFYWCWMNWFLVFLYFIHSVYFILIYLINFVDFHWYFEVDSLIISVKLKECVAFTSYIWLFALFDLD